MPSISSRLMLLLKGVRSVGGETTSISDRKCPLTLALHAYPLCTTSKKKEKESYSKNRKTSRSYKKLEKIKIIKKTIENIKNY